MSLTNLAKAEQAHQGGDIAQAKRLYRLVLEDDANSASALYGLGTVALQENAPQEAEKLLSRASVLEPAAADIALNYAVACNRNGNKQDAIEHALRSARLAIDDESFLNTVCQLLLRLQQAELVLALKTEQELQHAGKLIDSQIIVARAYGMLGQWDGAVALLRALSLSHSQNSRVCRELSIAAARLRDYPLAIESYQQFMQLVNCGVDEHVRLADLFLLARDKQGLDAQLACAHKLGANDAEYHVLCARLARLNGDNHLARVGCESALKKQPDHGPGWSLLLELTNNEESEPYIETLERAIEQTKSSNNNRASLHFAYASALQKLERYRLAFEQFRAANRLHELDLHSRGVSYSAKKNEAQFESTLRHFVSSCVGANNEPGPTAPIFIVGMPRSGTTLMEKLLAQLDGVTAGGEIESLNFVAAQYQADVNNRVKPLPSAMTALQWQQVATQYFSRVPTAKPFLTDKLPHNFNNVGLALALFPNVRILQMRRDPRDVCLSIYSHQFPDGHAYACDFDSLAHAYSISQKLMDYWVELAPSQVMDVSYEALAENPQSVGKAAVEFCGLEWSDDCLGFFENPNASFTFSELQVRERINTARVGRWRLYEEELEELSAALRKYGVL
ncbi:MAG: sulfotransferase [Pseudomonadales bacterium]